MVARIFADGVPDAHMAEVIDREFVQKGEKALVFCGTQHIFTRYRSTEYEKNAAEMKLPETRRAGNIVYRGDRRPGVLHLPPCPVAGPGLAHGTGLAGGWRHRRAHRRPAAGEKERGIRYGGNPPGRAAGDDRRLRPRPLGGQRILRMADLFDGYVIQGPLPGYRRDADPRLRAARRTRHRAPAVPGRKAPVPHGGAGQPVIADDAAAVEKLLALFR